MSNPCAFCSPSLPITIDALDEMNDILQTITEEQYDKVVQHLKLDIVNPDEFVKVNECKPIDNPRAFDRDSIPSDDGLLSNKIFGITKDDRAGIFAYIDLHGWFMDPSCYKAWSTMDVKVKNCVHGIDTYSSELVGLIGVPVNIDYEGSFDEATITFHYDEDLLLTANQNIPDSIVK